MAAFTRFELVPLDDSYKRLLKSLATPEVSKVASVYHGNLRSLDFFVMLPRFAAIYTETSLLETYRVFLKLEVPADMARQDRFSANQIDSMVRDRLDPFGTAPSQYHPYWDLSDRVKEEWSDRLSRLPGFFSTHAADGFLGVYTSVAMRLDGFRGDGWRPMDRGGQP